LEEQITIGESSHDPREQTGEAGDRGGVASKGSRDPAENLLEQDPPLQLDLTITERASQRNPRWSIWD
jgi:hypothetical protein